MLCCVVCGDNIGIAEPQNSDAGKRKNLLRLLFYFFYFGVSVHYWPKNAQYASHCSPVIFVMEVVRKEINTINTIQLFTKSDVIPYVAPYLFSKQ